MNTKEPRIDIIPDNNIINLWDSLNNRGCNWESSDEAYYPDSAQEGQTKVAYVLRLNCTIWIMAQVIVILK